MVRDSNLIVSILHYCINGTPDWRLDLTVEDLFDALPPDAQTGWTADALEGHVRLLADAGLIEMKSTVGITTIVRLTWAGHDYLENQVKSNSLRDNPFLQ